MQRVWKYIILVSLVPVTVMAQQAKPLQFKWSVSGVKPPQLLVKPEPKFQLTIQPQSIKYTLPKAAIFCRMEDVFYKHFNVLFKIRMGTDDKYSN